MQNKVLVDNASSQGVPLSIGSWAVNGKFIRAAMPLFTGSGNYRLLASSPYSVACTTGCDFAATDGKDVSVDAGPVETATSGSSSGSSGVERLGLRIDPGNTCAILRYTAPDNAACSVTVFQDAARRPMPAPAPPATNSIPAPATWPTASAGSSFWAPSRR